MLRDIIVAVREWVNSFQLGNPIDIETPAPR
jgi:hypothetical protein